MDAMGLIRLLALPQLLSLCNFVFLAGSDNGLWPKERVFSRFRGA